MVLLKVADDAGHSIHSPSPRVVLVAVHVAGLLISPEDAVLKVGEGFTMKFLLSQTSTCVTKLNAALIPFQAGGINIFQNLVDRIPRGCRARLSTD